MHYKNPYISPSLGNYEEMRSFVNLPFIYDNIDKIASDSKSRLHNEDILSHYRKLCKKWFKTASLLISMKVVALTRKQTKSPLIRHLMT